MGRFRAVVHDSTTDSRICIRTSLFQGQIACLLILACIATAVAATVLGVNSLIWQTSASYYFKISSTCDPLQSSMGSGYGITRYTRDSDWKIERCKFYLNMMMVRREVWFSWDTSQPLLLGSGALEGKDEGSVNLALTLALWAGSCHSS